MSSFPAQVLDNAWNAEADTLLVGQAVRLAAAPAAGAPPGLLRAQADVAANVSGLIGVVFTGAVGPAGGCQVVLSGRAKVRMEAGLVLVPGERLFVSSATEGLCTNVAPGTVAPIGILRDATNYSAANPIVEADIQITGTETAAAAAQNVVETGLLNGQGAILAVGEVVNLGAPNNTIRRARANLIVTVNNTIGVVQAAIGIGGTGSVVTQGRASIRLAAGVVPVVGDVLWVSSATAGVATNVQPNLNNYPIGVVKDTTGYVDPGNPIVVADIFPQPGFTAFNDRIPIGNGATASAAGAVSIGTGGATNTNTVAIGSAGTASGDSSIAIGTSVTSSGLTSISIGDNSSATASSTVAIGRQANAAGATGSIAIGFSSRVTAGGNAGVAIGNDADVNGSDGIAIGHLAISGSGGNAGGIAIGPGANSQGVNSVVIGTSSRSDSTDTVVIGGTAGGANVNTNSTIVGASANAGGGLPTGIVVIGQAASANGNDAIAIGRAASVGAHTGAIVIGVGAASSAANQCTIGAASAGGEITVFRVLNNGSGTTLSATSAPAANLAGLVININNGAVVLRTVAIGAAGSGSIAAHRMLQVPD